MKRISITENLLSRMYGSETYKKYVEEYNSNNRIDIELLKEFLKEYRELFDIFLKVNILIYRYPTEQLRISLKEYTKHNGRNLYMDDMCIISNHYISNYVRCKKAIKTIIQNKLVCNSEVQLLKKIYSRNEDEEIL